MELMFHKPMRMMAFASILCSSPLVDSKAWTPTVIYGTAWKKDCTRILAQPAQSAIQQGSRAFDTANQPKHCNGSLVGAALYETLSNPAWGLARLGTFGFRRSSLLTHAKTSHQSCALMTPTT
ncbi:unnamed protein product [Polarella glacialis]|uniref:Uncharacterized protein n=1 Tax=Polarella glacialis TaxID=89957 RepID=A0A813DXW9_POLGL|nr:unnamed protein product [Polarella glacialis]